jgi:hypothetical protein
MESSPVSLIESYVVLLDQNSTKEERETHLNELKLVVDEQNMQANNSDAKSQINFYYDALPGYTGMFSNVIAKYIREQKVVKSMDQYIEQSKRF